MGVKSLVERFTTVFFRSTLYSERNCNTEFMFKSLLESSSESLILSVLFVSTILVSTWGLCPIVSVRIVYSGRLIECPDQCPLAFREVAGVLWGWAVLRGVHSPLAVVVVRPRGSKV